MVKDAKDANGDGKTDDLIPDFGSFPKATLGFEAKMDQPLKITLAQVPSYGTPGQPFHLLCLAGVMQPDRGWVPLGLYASVPTADKKLTCPVRWARSAMELNGKRVITVIASTPIHLKGEARQRVMHNRYVSAFPATLDIPSSPQVPVNATFSIATRSFQSASLPASASRQLTLQLGHGQKWQIWSRKNHSSFTLPNVPQGFVDPIQAGVLARVRTYHAPAHLDLGALLSLNQSTLKTLGQVSLDATEIRLQP